MFLGIGHFVHRKALHGRDILFDFAIFEVRNGNLSKVNDEESLDLVPVFNVFFSLINREKKILLLFSLRFGALKHRFDAHFVLVYFVDKFSFFLELFDRSLLSDRTSFFFTNCSHQTFEVHHFSFDPVSDVLEWVIKLF